VPVGPKRGVSPRQCSQHSRRYRIETRLRAHYPSTYTFTRNGITFVYGIDPDGIRVLITHPNPQQFPREVIDERFR
jgi:hypothetical protein